MESLRSLMKHRLAGTVLWPFRDIRRSTISELDTREAYRLWAPTYIAETAPSFLDDELACQMLRGLPQTRLLDAGCGIGRGIADVPGR